MEVTNTKKRIEYEHRKAPRKGPLESDAYSRMQKEGLWDAKKILDEYISVKDKNSCLPVSLRQMIVVIFETACTNFWAKQIKKESDKAFR